MSIIGVSVVAFFVERRQSLLSDCHLIFGTNCVSHNGFEFGSFWQFLVCFWQSGCGEIADESRSKNFRAL